MAFCDEAAAWKYRETMDMLLFGLRVGVRLRMLITTFNLAPICFVEISQRTQNLFSPSLKIIFQIPQMSLFSAHMIVSNPQ